MNQQKPVNLTNQPIQIPQKENPEVNEEKQLLNEALMNDMRTKMEFECFKRNNIQKMFFQMREVHQRCESLQIQMQTGIPSELLFEQQPIEQNNIKLFRLTNEAKKQIFRQFPEVQLAYTNEVPRNRGEREFWKMFFKTYVMERNEKKDDTNLFYRYLQEYDRTHPQQETKERYPLEISLEDRSNNPCAEYIEAYEPQDNDDTTIEEQFTLIRKKLVLHTHNIEKQIQAKSVKAEVPTRQEITQVEEVPEVQAQPFRQCNATMGYNELMRQSELEHKSSEQKTVSHSERQAFTKNLVSFKKNIGECINRPENTEFMLSQLEQVEREAEDLRKMKEHTAIPQHIQMELLKAQYNVYCILHYATWRLTDKQIKMEEIEATLQIVYRELISFWVVWGVSLTRTRVINNICERTSRKKPIHFPIY